MQQSFDFGQKLNRFQIIFIFCGRAVVVERSRASYLIGILGMLKVEGSNPGFADFLYEIAQSLDKNKFAIFANSSIFGMTSYKPQYDVIGSLHHLSTGSALDQTFGRHLDA